MKQLGKSSKDIAAKLGWTEKQVDERFEALFAAAKIFQENGYNSLIHHFNDALATYQSLGNKFIPICTALSSPPDVKDVSNCYVEGDPDQTVINILSRFIVLRPFLAPPPPTPEVPPDPAKN